jgi:probable phosphoglycerate mutase
MIAWDWLPQDLDRVDAFFGEKTWMDPEPMAESDVREKYEAVCEGIDALLLKHGYKREGRVYRALHPNHDCIALFCHFGVESVILSHMLNSSPMPLWHGFCALPSSITTVFTEERREGTASFRITEYGALPHLYLAGEEPSFSARFCECYTDDTRHD